VSGHECKECGSDMEWARYKDVPLHFADTTKFVTIEAYLCPVCDALETEIDP
jgi:hypothetical protein